jgi:hypothetical protein
MSTPQPFFVVKWNVSGGVYVANLSNILRPSRVTEIAKRLGY